MAYINIEKDFFEKNKKEFEKEAISNGDDNGYIYNDKIEGEIEEIDLDAGTINVKCESKIGYISMDIRLTQDDLLSMIELAVKKLNKFKTVLEGLK